jgi:hypothetical protein
MMRTAVMKTGMSDANPVTMNMTEYAIEELKNADSIPFLRLPKM